MNKEYLKLLFTDWKSKFKGPFPSDDDLESVARKYPPDIWFEATEAGSRFLQREKSASYTQLWAYIVKTASNKFRNRFFHENKEETTITPADSKTDNALLLKLIERVDKNTEAYNKNVDFIKAGFKQINTTLLDNIVTSNFK